MHLRTGTVSQNRRVGPDYVHLSIREASVAGAARPGQFVTLRLDGTTDPLLRRPFSVHEVTGPDTFAVLFRVVGRSTELLAAAAPGEPVSVLGPLGQGFAVDPDAAHHLVVGGGIGAAPLLFLVRDGVDAGRFTAATCTVVLGARTAGLLAAVPAFQALPVRTVLVTDDGSRGERGDAVGALAGLLDGATGRCAVYACGPKPMVRALARLAADRPHVTVQVSVEERMACGLGACRGCTVTLDTPRGRRRAAACTEGPVFPLALLDTEEP